MENVLLDTLKTLSLVLVTLTFISVAVVQYMKETWNVDGTAAEVTSLVVGFLLSGAVAVSYLEQMAWDINVSQGISIGLFMVIGTISPSGGYKTLRTLFGKEE